MRKLQRAAEDVAELAKNARAAASNLRDVNRERRASSVSAPPATIGSGGGGRGGGGGSFAIMLQQLGAIQAALGQVSANVSGTAAAARLAERQAGG